jgi:two-component system, NtrC family, sensor kinase
MRHEEIMKIAVIGGGRRCEAFLHMLDSMRFPRLKAQIVAVADPNPDAAGMQLARRKGIATTGDFQDFFKIPDLDTVIELTGNEELLEDFLRRKPPHVRVLEATISRLFSDTIRFMEEYLFDKHQLELIQGIVESIFSSIQDRVMILQPNMKIVDANDAILETLGLQKEDVLGKFCYQVSHWAMAPCSEKGLDCPLMESRESGRPAYAIHEHFDRNNQTRTCEVTVVPLKNSEGKVELLIEILRDITDELERRVEQRTRFLTDNLTQLIHEDKMIALGKLVASSVHEINNPLSGIHALARLVQQGLEAGVPGEEELKQYRYYLQLIDSESARCSAIVSNLLSFARQQRLEMKYFQLNELIHRIALLFGHKMQLQGIELRMELPDDLPRIFGDPGQIQQCLVNLAFNAMEAMPEGGALTIRTGWEESRNLIRLEVEDTGCGISEEMMSHIFEPFFSTKNHEKGVGLGLSVVYGIIKEHQGSIFVKSDPGKGSKFIIRFFAYDTPDSVHAEAT